VIPLPPPAPASRPATPAVGGTTEPLGRQRLAVGQRMVESLRVSAQLTATAEVDLTAVAKLRSRANTRFEAREGTALTDLAFIAVAVVEALKQHPQFNAVIDAAAGAVAYADGVHLGVAVDTPKGLLVPVVRDAGDLTVGGLAKKIADLTRRGQAAQMTPDDLTGGTFTVVDYSQSGTLFDTPVINQPEVAILGVGALVKRPVVVQERLGEIIAVRDMAYLSLTYDHRLIASPEAGRFLAAVKARLEAGDFGAEFGLHD
jgi:2-oxoglutarate dehydrogenase E2 component (dihydrolipoamide succinyltransferase)